MKLYELINFEPKQSSQDRVNYSQKVRAKTNAKSLGAGAFGAAYDINSNKRLNQVTKIGRVGKFNALYDIVDAKTVDEDGYLIYLKEVYELQQGGTHNPYFPRIHDLTIRQNPDGTMMYRVNLEKLYPLYTPKLIDNEDLMKSLCNGMFNLDYELPDNFSVTELIAKKLNICGKYNGKAIRDPNLNQALTIIHRLIQEGNTNGGRLSLDLHGGNIMWRITGTMPQLVLLDPIA